MKNTLLVAFLGLLFVSPTFAQTTFNVAVVPESNHPDPNANPEVYEVDGVQGAELTLVRGQSYVFQMNDVPTLHPFFISTSETGGDGGASAWSDGVTGNFATGGATLTFVVPDEAPDLLYYQCQNHMRMGWRLNIVDPTSIEGELPEANFDLSVGYPNPSSGQISLELGLDETKAMSIEVFDVAGRRVAVLHEGVLAAGPGHSFVLNGEDLPGGVYIIRATDGSATVERQVTLVR